jgi:AraC family transcriptional regulator
MSNPVLKKLDQTVLVGLNIQTSLSENKTRELWQAFGPKQREIQKRVNPEEKWSVEIYEPGFKMMNFTPQSRFEKWAAVEVTDSEDIPEGMDSLVIPEGKYAVFTYKGLHKDFPDFARYIFGEWLPSSGYQLDDRPHFEIMDKRYHGPMDPESEEEIWIPISSAT